MNKLLLSLLLLTTPLLADPWGKNADLTFFPPTPQQAPEKKNPLITASIAFIQFHQDVISPADGPRSHYFPSSSQYTLEAIKKYGFFKGWALGCDRLMRENSDKWVYKEVISPQGCKLKHNPVP